MSDRETAEYLIAAEEAALERWRVGDPDGFLEIIADDYTYFDPYLNKRLDNYESIKKLYDSLRGTIEFDKFELIDPKVQLEGNVGILTFNLKSYDLESSNTAADTIDWHATEVYRKLGKDWKLISTHWSFTRSQLIRSDSLNALPAESAPVEQHQIPPVSGEAAGEVIGLERAAFDRWGNGDPSGFIEMVSDDYTYFDPSLDRRLNGAVAFDRYMEPVRGKIRIDRYEMIDPRVQTDGNNAVLTFNYIGYRIDEQGEEKPGNNWHATEIYRKIDGIWRLISTHWSFTQSTILRLSESGHFKSDSSANGKGESGG